MAKSIEINSLSVERKFSTPPGSESPVRLIRKMTVEGDATIGSASFSFYDVRLLPDEIEAVNNILRQIEKRLIVSMKS